MTKTFSPFSLFRLLSFSAYEYSSHTSFFFSFFIPSSLILDRSVFECVFELQYCYIFCVLVLVSFMEFGHLTKSVVTDLNVVIERVSLLSSLSNIGYVDIVNGLKFSIFILNIYIKNGIKRIGDLFLAYN